MIVSVLRIFLLFTFVFCLNCTFVQGQVGDSLRIELTPFEKAIRYNRELSSYVFTQGLGNLEPLLIEARVAPSFFFTNRRRTYAIQFTPNIVLRIKNKKSYPVDNPSYLTPLYYHQKLPFWGNTFLSTIHENSYFSLGLHHHSNGQDGEFYAEDSTINIDDGSFSTNYFSVALNTYNYFESVNMPAFRGLQIYYEHHVPSKKFFAEELTRLYGLYRLFLKYQILNFERKEAKKARWFFSNSSVQTQVGWIFGSMGSSPATSISDRLIFRGRYILYPHWLDEVAVFIEFYRGQDYYNMRFGRTLNVLRFGLISDPLNVGQPRNIFK